MREILGSTPVKGSKYEKLLTLAISSGKNISIVIPAKWTYLSALQWHNGSTTQHHSACSIPASSLPPTAPDASSAPTSPVHSSPFQPALIIATQYCIPLDVNLDPPSGKGMFSEFKSKGWMAEAWSPNVCARQKTTVPGVHNLPSRPGRVAGILQWFPTSVEKYLE